jgi:uncharacterized membrane protein
MFGDTCAMQRAEKAGGTLGGLATLLVVLTMPGVGLILLIVGIVIIAVLLGVGAVIYLTLQSLHIWTATVFTVAALFLFYIAVKTKIINEQTLQKFPWLSLLIPGAFLFGYVADIAKLTTYTVAPMAVATPQQASANALVLFLLIAGVLYMVSEYVGGSKPPERTRRRRRQ